MFEYLFTGIEATDVALLLNRTALGTAFMLSGFHKTFVAHRHAALIETLEYAKVPMPRYTCWLVCLTEFFAGLGLIVGLMSTLAALGLLAISVVAFVTVERFSIAAMKPEDVLDWIDDLFWVPAVMFGLLALVVIFAGPGAYSLDAVILTLL